MEQIVNDQLLATGYLLAWILVFAWYQFMRPVLDAGSAIIGTYILYAVFSIFSINDPVFSSSFEPLEFFPYLYLFLMLLIALSPAIYNHLRPAKTIKEPHTRVLTCISVIIIVCGLLQVPSILSNFNEGLVKLFLDSDAGKDAYESHMEDIGDSGSAITNLPAVIFNSLFDISVFLFFYILTLKKRNIYLVIGMGFSIFIGMMLPVMSGLRGGVIISLLTVIAGYMFFRQYLSKKLNRVIQGLCIFIVIIVSLPIIAISVSRFDGRSSSGVMGAINWYVGQGSLYFNNYGLDAGGIRNGDRTANLFKRVIDSDTPRNYDERRNKYYYLEMDDYYFTTFVGDFTIDYGPVAAVFIFIIFNGLVLTQIRPRDGTLRLDQMLLVFFTVCICMQGGMTLFSYSDTAGIRIVTQGGLYAYLRYHDALLEKFPSHTEEQNPSS